MRLAALLILLTTALSADQSGQAPLTVDELLARMAEYDSQRNIALHGYTAVRRYVLENARHNKRAEMLVRTTCLEDGSKRFEVISESGWGGARKHVFPRLLEGETEASLPDKREESRITPRNYSFDFVRTDYIDGRAAYVLNVSPKTQNKYLMRGTIWVDADDYAIVRIDGVPAKSPSFWIKSVHFVHMYAKNGPFWFPASDHSVTDAWLFGNTEVTIDYFDYLLDPTLSASSTGTPPSLPLTSTSNVGGHR
jgi:hypothetical protein